MLAFSKSHKHCVTWKGNYSFVRILSISPYQFDEAEKINNLITHYESIILRWYRLIDCIQWPQPSVNVSNSGIVKMHWKLPEMLVLGLTGSIIMTLGIRYHFYSGWPKAKLQFADKLSYCVLDFSDDKIYFIEPLIGLMNSPFLDEELVGLDTSRWPPPQGPPTASPQSLQEQTWPIGTLDICFQPINAVQHFT